MQVSRPDAVRVEVAANLVEISPDERDRLLQKLRVVSGFDAIIAKFEAAGLSTSVHLDLAERFRLRIALEVWEYNTDELPDGIARLLDALVKTDTGGRSPRTGGAS